MSPIFATLTSRSRAATGKTTFESAAKKPAAAARNRSNQAMAHELSTAILQRKLTINQPGDAFEQEADRVADAVMRMPDSFHAEGANHRHSPDRLQRCSCGQSAGGPGQCDECEAKNMDLHRVSSGASETDTAPSIVHDVLRSPGRPLDSATRNFMEPRFGQDFSGVRVHSDARAAESARAVNALAYTVGSDIVFDQGQLAANPAGNRLLAHELSHVVQQTGGSNEQPHSGARTQAGSGTTESASQLSRACNTAIGTRTECDPSSEDPVGELILFKLGCDEYASNAELTRVKDFADSLNAGDRVRIHGFASTDGAAAFNQNLSCARAQAARATLVANGIDASKTEILTHGPTPGPATQRRSVVLERNPGLTRPSVPQLKPVIDVVPTPGICGDMNFVIHWEISRNSNAHGGFVLQDITIDIREFDCTGAAVFPPGPRSPVHYFEAWQVNPASTTLSAADGNTDTFGSILGTLNLSTLACATGSIEFHGIATYHDNVAALPATMTRNNPATFAQNLRSSVNDPHLGGLTSRPVFHDLVYRWNCCPCRSAPSITVSHRP